MKLIILLALAACLVEAAGALGNSHSLSYFKKRLRKLGTLSKYSQLKKRHSALRAGRRGRAPRIAHHLNGKRKLTVANMIDGVGNGIGDITNHLSKNILGLNLQRDPESDNQGIISSILSSAGVDMDGRNDELVSALGGLGLAAGYHTNRRRKNEFETQKRNLEQKYAMKDVQLTLINKEIKKLRSIEEMLNNVNRRISSSESNLGYRLQQRIDYIAQKLKK